MQHDSRSKMMNKYAKYLYAYKNIATPSLVITLLLCYNFLTANSSYVIIYLVWMKLASLAALMAYIYFFKSSMLYFFYNLGMTRSFFFASLLMIDMAIFSIALVCTSSIK